MEGFKGAPGLGRSLGHSEALALQAGTGSSRTEAMLGESLSLLFFVALCVRRFPSSCPRSSSWFGLSDCLRFFPWHTLGLVATMPETFLEGLPA